MTSLNGSCCDLCDIDYVDEKENISIRFGSEYLNSFLYSFIENESTQKLISGNLALDTQMHDIGFECNQSSEGKSTVIDNMTQYHYFSNSHKNIRPFYNSWLYNDQEGNIWFEITPFYPWHHTNRRSYPDKISYKEWIKGYKSTLKVMVPQGNLIQWINQAKELKDEINGK
jgi:hypothetical protein